MSVFRKRTDYNISQHHIVINTNKRITNTPESHRLVWKFMWIIQDVFSEENADDMLWIFCKGKSHDLIYLFKLTTAIEWKSSKLKQLHAHVLIFLTYARDCKLHVAYDRLRASIANALGMPIHFEGKLLDNKQMLEQMQQNQINYVLKEYLGINRNKEK